MQDKRNEPNSDNLDDLDLEQDKPQGIPTSSNKRSNTKLVATAFVGLAGIAVIVGTSLIDNKDNKETKPSTMPSIAQTAPVATTTPAPTVANSTANLLLPKVTEDKEVKFDELSKAFTKAEQAVHPKAQDTVSIDEIKEELFQQKPSIPAPTANEINKISTAMQALEQLNQQMSYNLTQIKALEAYTREVSQTIAKLNNTINAMDGRILALSNTAQGLSNEVGTVKNEIGSFKRAFGDELDSPKASFKEQAIQKSEPDYILHAVIPGRAWLKNAYGQILTVTEGDNVGDYGKVLVIDATNGVVLTNSGVTFR